MGGGRPTAERCAALVTAVARAIDHRERRGRAGQRSMVCRRAVADASADLADAGADDRADSPLTRGIRAGRGARADRGGTRTGRADRLREPGGHVERCRGRGRRGAVSRDP